MISPAFVLCSALLLTGVIADLSIDKKQLTDSAKKMGFSLLGDILGGKDIQKALTDRGIEAAGSVGNDLGSGVKSALKRLQELQDGGEVGDVASNLAKAIMEKQKGKVPAVDNLLKLIGDENLDNLMKGGAKALTNLFG